MITLSYSIGEDNVLAKIISVNDVFFKIRLWLKAPSQQVTEYKYVNSVSQCLCYFSTLNRLLGHLHVKLL